MPELISIITDWGGFYGSGHAQRMASLCRALNEAPGVSAVLVNGKTPDFLAGSAAFTVSPVPAARSDLIIRDMRDSSSEEIFSLRKTAPVLVIDDIGPGRGAADFVLDLLPNPAAGSGNADYREDCYLYGHNFIDSLRSLGQEILEKNIDLAMYAGAGAADADIGFFRSLVPEGKNAVIMAGPVRHTVNIPPGLSLDAMNYAEVLLRSRVFIAHFGLSLYEARLCGCAVLSVNPTPYHSRLADMVPGSVVDINAGTRGELDEAGIRGLCRDLLESRKFSETVPGEILEQAQRKLYACRDHVLSLK
ncbi:MAG TPA: hypothetical protein PK926_03040 [Spirochaetota bacterium]|nr:hypothetical protein [Spirochaetota bacterium]HPI87943.1 hypothetical protein [Spirochaetota bacterium]HPR46653.1 hypothetical protein [Spirochaetota bacterium]